MEYKLITVSVMWSFKRGLDELTQAVNESIARGWEPQGGPAFSQSSIVQAMIKRR